MAKAPRKVYYLFTVSQGTKSSARWYPGQSMLQAKELLATACNVPVTAVTPLRDNGMLLALQEPKRTGRHTPQKVRGHLGARL